MQKNVSANPLVDFNFDERPKLSEIARNAIVSTNTGNDGNKQKPDLVCLPKNGVAQGTTKRKSMTEKGCRDGYSRHTYILPKLIIEQIHNISRHMGQTEGEIMEQLLTKGIEEVQSKHGTKIVSSPSKKPLL